MAFFSESFLSRSSWQAWERSIQRLLRLKEWHNVQVVGGSGDRGADVIAEKLINGKKSRWVFQVKAWNTPVGLEVLKELQTAMNEYQCPKGVIVSKRGFKSDLKEKVKSQEFKTSVILWDQTTITNLGNSAPKEPLAELNKDQYKIRPYQEQAVKGTVKNWQENKSGRALIVMATGLGKTFVGASAIRRILNLSTSRQRVLVLAHKRSLLLQLERAFWPFLSANEETMIVKGGEELNPKLFKEASFVFGMRQKLDSMIEQGTSLPRFDIVLVDECHHAGTNSYNRIFEELEVGEPGGPFLIGLTATDWRPSGAPLEPIFGDAVARVDMLKGLRMGYLTDVDYRMYTDNLDWEQLTTNHEGIYNPKQISKSIFITEWDNAVAGKIKSAWDEIKSEGTQPRGIIFCANIRAADRMARQINAMNFTKAAAIHSGLSQIETNKMLWDFSEGKLGIVTAIDSLSEGIDVPDINLVVFQRVTHSRRIFIQQLGRGLRISEGKTKTIVLDFVTDIKRIAAGLALRQGLDAPPQNDEPPELTIGSKVTFLRGNSNDSSGAAFLEAWLSDYKDLDGDELNQAELRFPNPETVNEFLK